VVVCDCPRDRLCEICLARAWDTLRGVAATRGEVWAEDIARRVGLRKAWPGYDGLAAAIAARKVADLSEDPRLRARLAVELARWAARRWEAMSAALL
jgi:hypothetical protein